VVSDVSQAGAGDSAIFGVREQAPAWISG
jgi:hypothetical protein